MTIDALIAAIESAFAGVPRGDVSLHEAEVIDSYGTETERRKARALDPEQDWRDVPDASLAACRNALPYLDPVSWRFYLPAFMRSGLRELHGPHSLIDEAIYALALHDDRQLNDPMRGRFGNLDPTQARVVRRFLELASENGDYCDDRVARQALDRYWSKAGEAS